MDKVMFWIDDNTGMIDPLDQRFIGTVRSFKNRHNQDEKCLVLNRRHIDVLTEEEKSKLKTYQEMQELDFFEEPIMYYIFDHNNDAERESAPYIVAIGGRQDEENLYSVLEIAQVSFDQLQTEQRSRLVTAYTAKKQGYVL